MDSNPLKWVETLLWVFQSVLTDWPISREQAFWSAAPKGFTGEPVFVAKPGSTREDEGWVFDLVYDAGRDRTDIVILDAEHVSQGPIARLHLRNHIPYGLHDSFNDTLVPDLLKAGV